MNDTKYSFITEQGYPMGQFGCTPVNEEENKKLAEELEKDKKEKE